MARFSIWQAKRRTQLPGIILDFVNGGIDLDLFITHHLEFKDINEASNLLRKRELIRIILSYSDLSNLI